MRGWVWCVQSSERTEKRIIKRPIGAGIDPQKQAKPARFAENVPEILDQLNSKPLVGIAELFPDISEYSQEMLMIHHWSIIWRVSGNKQNASLQASYSGQHQPEYAYFIGAESMQLSCASTTILSLSNMTVNHKQSMLSYSFTPRFLFIEL